MSFAIDGKIVPAIFSCTCLKAYILDILRLVFYDGAR